MMYFDKLNMPHLLANCMFCSNKQTHYFFYILTPGRQSRLLRPTIDVDRISQIPYYVGSEIGATTRTYRRRWYGGEIFRLS